MNKTAQTGQDDNFVHNKLLSRNNRLYWLGRYNERVYTTVKYIMGFYDLSIESGKTDYETFCRKLSIPSDVYSNTADFFRKYIFDIKNFDSIAANADYMLGNGMVLRETISSDTLSYLQMAVNALNLASKSSNINVQLQWVLDDIMAFRGSFDDFMENERLRNIVKCGISVERISLYTRLGIHREELETELHKLLNRSYKTNLNSNDKIREKIFNITIGSDIPFSQRRIPAEKILDCVENLFVV
jgi:hypothetical protein